METGEQGDDGSRLPPVQDTLNQLVVAFYFRCGVERYAGEAVARVIVGWAILGTVVAGVGLVGGAVRLVAIGDVVHGLRPVVGSVELEAMRHPLLHMDVERVVVLSGVGLGEKF